MPHKIVLITEIEQAIRDVLAMALEIEGDEVYSAANGQAGLKVLEQIPNPCLIHPRSDDARDE